VTASMLLTPSLLPLRPDLHVDHSGAQCTDLRLRLGIVSRHVLNGKLNKEIAAAVGIHERTVKLHRSTITTKLGARSVAEITTLVRLAGVFEELRCLCS
jgi:DNA-binding NarL/FixJ family response regulator